MVFGPTPRSPARSIDARNAESGACGVGVGVGLGVGVGDGVGVGVAEGSAVGDGPAVAVGLGVDVGFGGTVASGSLLPQAVRADMTSAASAVISKKFRRDMQVA